MKASEILRKLADVVSAAEAGEQSLEHGPQNVDNVKLAPVDVDHSDDSESPLFVPPLQAKLEILKKSVGMDNVYDEVGDVKRMAGLKPAQQEAADDEPFEG